jgi:HEAT repeat protein
MGILPAFVIWAVLIILTAIFHRKIRRWELHITINSLNSRFWFIRRDGVYALGKWYWGRDELALEALGKALDDKDERVALAAAKVLKNKDKIIAFNLKAIERSDSRMLKVINDIEHYLEDGNPASRSLACRKLGEIGFVAAQVLPKLKELAAYDPDITVRNHAKRAIAKIEPLPYEKLVELLDDHNWLERKYAAEALGYIGPEAKRMLPKLKEIIEFDDSRQVRDAAKITIARFDNPAET